MANHKSALKSYRQAVKRTERNKSRISKIRSYIRHVEQAIQSGSQSEAQERFKTMQSELMKGVRRNMFHLNTAARKVSRIATRIKALQK